MTVARGDTKPCIYSGCSGTMQFARESKTEEAQAWLCSASPKHVHRPADIREKERAAAIARSAGGWEDDGGGGRARK